MDAPPAPGSPVRQRALRGYARGPVVGMAHGAPGDVMTRGALLLLGLACAATCGVSRADPYVDPHLLDMPWGGYSFVRQAWRGYLETIPARTFVDGLGIVWSQPPHKSEEQIATDLAAAGFTRVRLEVPWGSINWEETGLESDARARTARVLQALRRHGLRPLILL